MDQACLKSAIAHSLDAVQGVEAAKEGQECYIQRRRWKWMENKVFKMEQNAESTTLDCKAAID